MRKILLINLFLFLTPTIAFAININIPDDQPNIQSGIDAAIHGDTILIADGTYTGNGNYNIDFKGKAITVKSANGPENCIIDCQQQGRGFWFKNEETETSVLDGLTIKNGFTGEDGGGVYAEGFLSPLIKNCVFENNSADNDGGAVCYYSSSFSFTNCTFTGNSASNEGGAVSSPSYPSSPSYSSFSDCTFIANHASADGGAVFSVDSSSSFTNCTFTANQTSDDGGAVFYYDSPPSFSDCTFTANSAVDDGGAVFSYSSTSFTNCTFTGNRASGDGGAIDSGAPSLTNCRFTGNHASDDGGAVCFARDSSSFSNCVFTNNSASDVGGAIYYHTYYGHYHPSYSFSNCTFTENTSNLGGAIFSNATNSSSFTNCTFTGNTSNLGGAVYYLYSYDSSSSTSSFINCSFTINEATEQGGTIWCDTPLVSNDPIILKNCILWNNTAPEGSEIYEKEKPLEITYSNIQGGNVGDGNIDVDPAFLSNKNLYLKPWSPCINTATDDGAPADDIDGYLRPIGNGYDMGAYEYRYDIFVWDGLTSDWGDANNWNLHEIPQISDIVVLSSPQAVVPDSVIQANDAVAGELYIESGCLMIAQGKLTIE
ncbi:MAG: hypothetical protein J7L25_07995 [Deltaproteobacteria bacterium]|nr:hypothetical protein [Candidatus Tharpella aukensis]